MTAGAYGDFDLLVFDWDGTLMDSQARIVSCVRGAIEALGAERRSDAEIRNIIGLGLNEAVLTLYPGAGTDFIGALSAAYRERFLELDPTPSTLFEGVREVLESLLDGGYRMAVATGKARAGLERGFAETGLGRYFHASRCADETRSKPHPRMLLEIMAETGVSPRRTLMIGDTEYDMSMSREAGAGGLAVSYGVHELDRLLRQEPLGFIDRITELPPWLETARAQPTS